MTNGSESNSTTNSAPPTSGASAVIGSTSSVAKDLPVSTSSQCRVNNSDFFSSPESEGRCCCCANCHMETKEAATTPDVRESPESPEQISPIDDTLKHIIRTETARSPPAKRARVEGVETNPSKSNKKKKKFSSILKGMMSPTLKPLDVDQEREALRRGLGGGNFEKVAKI